MAWALSFPLILIRLYPVVLNVKSKVPFTCAFTSVADSIKINKDIFFIVAMLYGKNK
jgi:hypothetical protein